LTKLLRHLDVRPEPDVLAVLQGNTNHLGWMYEHYLGPLGTGGEVGKINIILTGEQKSIPISECLGIADVWEEFDTANYPSLTVTDQQRYYLDRMHSALVRCARHFGWDPAPLSAARDRMLADHLQFAFLWKKPITSPDRQTKAQGSIEVGSATRLSLIFLDRQQNEIRRSLISLMPAHDFGVKFIFGSIAWIDNETVRVTQDNKRDYWDCTVSGQVDFHYPRAERGDASGEYALGRMYYEGTVVLQDCDRGLHLIQSAATKGNKHAIAFMARLHRQGVSP